MKQIPSKRMQISCSEMYKECAADLLFKKVYLYSRYIVLV